VRDDVYERVRQFVAREASVRVETLTPETRINYDLGVDGDDAVELLEAFMEEFRVDLSAFEFNRYFGPEGGPPPAFIGVIFAFPLLLVFATFTFLLDLVSGKRKTIQAINEWREQWRRESLTLEEIAAAAVAGCWRRSGTRGAPPV
jgi:acyl carrier protein